MQRRINVKQREMVNEVNKLIFNSLLEYRTISIPGVGTLRITYSPSRRARKGVVLSPSYNVAYSDNYEGCSLVNILSSVAKIEAPEAEDIIRRWREKSLIDNSLRIDGVGLLRSGVFTCDEELLAMLNRDNRVVLPTKSRRSALVWVVPMAIIVIAIASLVYLYPSISDIFRIDNQGSEQQIIADNNQVVEDAPVTDSEIVEEEATTVESIEDSTSEEPMTQQVTENNLSWVDQSVRHYVIYGSYSNMQNANSAIRKILRKNPNAECKILPLGRLYAVAVFGSNEIEECNNFKKRNRTLYKDAWVHTPKHLR